jgi:predicted transcriptional regulator
VETSVLLKQLSSDQRLKLLKTLKNKPSSYSELLKNLNFSSSSLTSHLQGLTRYYLIEKSFDKQYQLTSLGFLLLSHITSLDFISEHKQYFDTHDSSSIPHYLKNNLGDLQDSRLVGNGYFSTEELVNRIKDESAFLWLISNEFINDYLIYFEEFVEKGIKIKVIASGDLAEKVCISGSEVIRDNIDFRLLDEVELFLCVSDVFACFSLPRKDRSQDRDFHFFGTGDDFKQWCKTCFSYYWDQSSPIFEKL